jgi:hypothetical protein
MLYVGARKFFCRTPACPRRIFTERLPELVAPHGRWSHGLRAEVQQIGLALGEAEARLAQSLGMCTSPDTMLHLIRAAPLPAVGDVRVVGLDDWAWPKGWRLRDDCEAVRAGLTVAYSNGQIEG